MTLKVFSVFDIKADKYMTPFFMGATGEAVRAFKDLAMNRDSLVGRHPEDYKLIQIGEFDDSTGVVKTVTQVSLGFATDYQDKPKIAAVKGA